MEDQLNVPLEDAELLAEVELTTNLIIAATAAPGTMSQAEVDRVLGLDADRAHEAPVVPIQQTPRD